MTAWAMSIAQFPLSGKIARNQFNDLPGGRTILYKNVELYNAVDILPREGGGFQVSRIPLGLRAQLDHGVQKRVTHATGCEIRFNLLGDEATITLQMDEKPAIAELWSGPFMDLEFFIIGTGPTEIRISKAKRPETLGKIAASRKLPFDPELWRVLLPWRPAVSILDIKGDVAPPRPGQTPDKKYLAYGSSITHGNYTVHPSQCYPSRTARLLGVDLIHIGIGSGVLMEPEMADWLADRDDWNFASLEMGINMIPRWSTAEFAERIEYFVTTLARRHPDKWIFATDIFTFWMDFEEDDSKARGYRKAVRDLVKRLDMPKLVHIDGRRLLKDPTGLSGDAKHPAVPGMEEIGWNLAAAMRRKMGYGGQGTGYGKSE